MLHFKNSEPSEYKSNIAEIKILLSGSFIRKQIFVAGNKIAWVFSPNLPYLLTKLTLETSYVNALLINCIGHS